MSTTSDSSNFPMASFPTHWTLGNLQAHLGGVPVERILLYPTPGTATEADALRLSDHEDRLCELVDGVLVEKVKSSYESILTVLVAYYLHRYLEEHDLGIVTGPDGQLRILPTRMRVPDVAFIGWERFPDGQLPSERVYRVVPDLAVEILSEGNTPREMETKLDEYFEAGVRLVWYIDPATRSARIYRERSQVETIDQQGTLDGGDVLPEFSLRLGELFERAERRQSRGE